MGILQSSTLDEFLGDLPQSSDALSEQFQRLRTVPCFVAVAVSMSAIYCFWRIERELLHEMYAAQRTSWSEVCDALLQILTELQNGEPENRILSDLQDLFGMMNTKVKRGLRDLPAPLRAWLNIKGDDGGFGGGGGQGEQQDKGEQQDEEQVVVAPEQEQLVASLDQVESEESEEE